MKVEKIRLDSYNGRPAVLANITWENSDRPSQTIHFATLDRFSDYLNPVAASYAVGCLLPAMHHGEERLLLEGELCPDLRDGLDIVSRFMRMWYGPHLPNIRIDADDQQRPHGSSNSARAALIFSGSIDSLFSLRENKARYPEGHPAHLKDGIMVFSQNIESNHRPGVSDKDVGTFSDVAIDAGISLLPVFTNLRTLDNSSTFFINQFHGAVVGAASHAVSEKIHSVSVSADGSIPGLNLNNCKTFKPNGSHPLIDPYYSSHSLQIRHVGMTEGRVGKARLVAQWPVGLDNIRVCERNWPGGNCGSCANCVLAMLALTAVGALQRSRSFPIRQLTVDHIKYLNISPELIDGYDELVKPLKECGRSDLARTVKSVIAQSIRGQSNGSHKHYFTFFRKSR